jgi:hypothetical protein
VADSSVYEGPWLNGNRHGHYNNNDGWSYEGEFQNDKCCGQGKYTYEGAWLNDNSHGHGHYKHQNAWFPLWCL